MSGDGSLFAPSWAVERRNQLVDEVSREVVSAGLLTSDCILLAFARYIAAHEQPPVTSEERLAIELFDNGHKHHAESIRKALTALGLTLAKSGA